MISVDDGLGIKPIRMLKLDEFFDLWSESGLVLFISDISHRFERKLKDKDDSAWYLMFIDNFGISYSIAIFIRDIEFNWNKDFDKLYDEKIDIWIRKHLNKMSKN